jgi:hypothetical protein
MTMAQLAIFLLGSVATTAFGAEGGHTLPFDTVLIGTMGNELKDKDQTLTLGAVSIDALLVSVDADRNLSGPDKFKYGELARKVHNEPTAPLSVEEIALIKDRIGKVYPPEVITPAWHLIEGKPQ